MPMASGDEHGESEPTLTVAVRLPHLGESAAPLTRVVAATSSVRDLKADLARTLDGEPKQDGIVCVLGGRVLRDSEVLGSLAGAQADERAGGHASADDDDNDGEGREFSAGQADNKKFEVTVIVRPSAWTTAPPPPRVTPNVDTSAASAPQVTGNVAPSPSRPDAAATEPSALGPVEEHRVTAPMSPSGYSPGYLSALPADGAAAAAQSEPATPIIATAASPTPAPIADLAPNPYATYLTYLHRLVPLQRALLLLNLQKAHTWYRERLAAPPATLQARDRLPEVEDMLREVGVWAVVDERAQEAGKRWDQDVEMRAREHARGEEFRVVQIAGLPYLLHTPEALLADPGRSTPADREVYLDNHRTTAIYQVLTTMLQLVLTLQPSAPALAYGRAPYTPGRSGGPPAGGTGTRAATLPPDDEMRRRVAAALGGPPLPAEAAPGGRALAAGGPAAAAAAAGPRRRATLSVIINVDAILSLFIPMFLLSLKLAFLLWIFGRNASGPKRIALILLAAVWVGYEGWAIQRRRAQATRERERAERDRRRANRAAAQRAARAEQQQQAAAAYAQAHGLWDEGADGAGEGGVGAGGVGPHGAAGANQRQGNRADPAGPAPPQPPARHRERGHHHRTPPSRLSPRYWLNIIAAVGLVAEARELGLSPRFIAGRPIAPPSAARAARTDGERRREALRRAVRNVAVAAVLFFGTLSPEVERKRKKAIEKRERLLAERRRRLLVEAVAASASARPGSAAAADANEAAPAEATSSSSSGAAAGPSSLRQRRVHSTSTGAAPDPASTADAAAGSSRTDASASTSGPQGRERVSDAELFRDGPSEAYTSALGRPGAATANTNGTTSSNQAATPSGVENGEGRALENLDLGAATEDGPQQQRADDVLSEDGASPLTPGRRVEVPEVGAAGAAGAVGDAAAGAALAGAAERIQEQEAAAVPETTAGTGPPAPAPLAPDEDEDFASLTTTSTSASSSAGDSVDEDEEAEENEEEAEGEGGIARRVRARRARMLARREGGQRGDGAARQAEEDEVDRVGALF